MDRRNALTLLLALLVLPFTRFLDAWARPEFRRTIAKSKTQIIRGARVFINGVEMKGFRAIEYSLSEA